jgi:cell division protein FtsX
VIGDRPWRFLLAAVTIALPLAVLLVIAALTRPLAPLAQRLAPDPAADFLVAADTSGAEIALLRDRILQRPGVVAVEWIKREEALALLAQRTDLSYLPSLRTNPLPDLLSVRFDPGLAPESVALLVRELGPAAKLESLPFDIQWHRKLAAARAALRASGIGLLAALAACLGLSVLWGVAALLNPCSSRDAEVFALLGATPDQVARPCAHAAALLMAAAAILALATLGLWAGAGIETWQGFSDAFLIDLTILPGWPFLAAGTLGWTWAGWWIGRIWVARSKALRRSSIDV